MAFRRTGFERFGLFDEALDAGTPARSGGDTEMFSRVLAAGLRIVYEPAALCWHRHRRTWPELCDTLYGYGAYWYDDNGDLIDPSQYIQGKDRYDRYTHELRISSDADQRFRFVGGLFYQQQEHDIQQRYKIDNLGAQISVTGW